jgi:hypothetical protein
MMLAAIEDRGGEILAKIYSVADGGCLALVALRLGPDHYIRSALGLAFAGHITAVVEGGSRLDSVEALDVDRPKTRGFLTRQQPRRRNPQRLG